MLVRVRDTGAVMYLPQWEQMFPETSFPNPIPVETLNEFGADVVLDGAQPTPTFYQFVAQDGVEQINGQWFTKFVVVDMDQESKDAVDEKLKQSNKDKAAKLLTESDFYDLPNTANKITNIADIIAYRDALRVIALNPTVDVVFPEKPTTIWS